MATAVPAQLWEAFEDVAVYFTRKEWEQLQDGDKMLYRDQMLRNYQALVSLGYQGPTPDLIGRIQQGEVELWVYDDEEPGECICSKGLSPAFLTWACSFHDALYIYRKVVGLLQGLSLALLLARLPRNEVAQHHSSYNVCSCMTDP